MTPCCNQLKYFNFFGGAWNLNATETSAMLKQHGSDGSYIHLVTTKHYHLIIIISWTSKFKA